MAKSTNEVTPNQFAFNFLVGILSILTAIFLYFIFKDYQSFKESPSHIPLFLPYYIIIVLYVFVYEGFENLEFDAMFHRTKRLQKTFLFISQSISVLLVGIAIYLVFNEFLHLFLSAEVNLKNVPKGQFYYSILISITAIFLIFSSVCVLFSELIFKNDEIFERIGTIFIVSLVGFGVHTYLQHSFYDGYSSYISNLTTRMESYLAAFAIISLGLLIFNFVFLLVKHKKNIEDSKKLKQQLESNFVQRIDYSNKFTHITKFDKYGLALTRIEKEFDGKKDREFYGIINRFGEEILPNKYYFAPYNIPYYKNYPLIIVSELETNKMGVIDIYGTWIIETDKQSISFPNQANPSNETWHSHEKYLSLDDGSLLDLDDMVLVVKDWDSGVTEKTDRGFNHIYNAFYLNRLYQRINMTIVSVTIKD